MSESRPVPESDDQNERLQESAAEAWAAAGKAFYAFVLVLCILVGRAIQALFVLARPAVLVATIVAAGYTSMTLFSTVLVCYGGDISAVLLALAAVTLIPATLIIMAEDYGVWAIALATAGLEFLARLGLERAPPIVLAVLPPIALSAVILNFLVHGRDVPEPQNTGGNENETATRKRGTIVAGDDQPDHLHGDADGSPDHHDIAG